MGGLRSGFVSGGRGGGYSSANLGKSRLQVCLDDLYGDIPDDVSET